jgi:hypothetical protein
MTTRELTLKEVEDGKKGINNSDLSSTEIQALVRNMDASKKKWKHIKHMTKKYEDELRKENEILYFNYPSLFQLHAEDRLDSTFFDMLQLKRKIENGEITPEDATKVVGDKLFKRFLPTQQTTSEVKPMSYEDYYKQFSK